jgi:hypothetical protein
MNSTVSIPVTTVSLNVNLEQISKMLALHNADINRWLYIIGIVIVGLLVLCGLIKYLDSKCHFIQRSSRQDLSDNYQDYKNSGYLIDATRPMLNNYQQNSDRTNRNFISNQSPFVVPTHLV